MVTATPHPVTILGRIAQRHGPIGFHSDGGYEKPSNVLNTPTRASDLALESGVIRNEISNSTPRLGCSICYGCGGEFRPKRANNHYCSKACKQSAYRRRKVS